MTTYVAARNFAQTGVPSLGVLAGTYPVRIAQIEFYGVYAAGGTSPATSVATSVYNCTGASFSGGTTITPVPMRGGAPASTATAKYSYSSMSGTKSFLTIITAGGAGSATTSTYTFPFDYIIPPGNAIDVSAQGTLSSQYAWAVAVYYEELRLAWSF